jgi:hypothetical protein
VICKPLWDEWGINAMHGSVAPLWERLNQIEERVIVLRAKTPAGLAAKASIVLGVMPDSFSDDIPDRDRDWDAQMFRDLVSDIQALAKT